MHDPQKRLPGEAGFSVLLALGSLFLFYNAYKISGFEALSAPGTFPMFATGVMAVSAIAVALKTLKLPHSQEYGWAAIFPGFVIFMALMMVFYAFALSPLGFLPTSFVFLTVSTKIMLRSGWLRAAGLSALSLGLVYVVFRLVFAVLMPEGVVPEREIIAFVSGLFMGAN